MRRLTALLAFVIADTALGQPAKEADRAAKWEKEVASIEKRQTEHPPKKDSVVFAGSSTIRLWNLGGSFPGLNAVNSGFGGSEIRDVTHFADRLVFKHRPRAIVFYAGDNDINSRRTPEQVVADFRAFVAAAHKAAPKARVYFIAVKPSLARWGQFETQSKANALVKAVCEKDDWLAYINVVPALLGPDGKPRPELYAKDGLHLSPAGYEVLSKLVAKSIN
jgi:lysophospholipase L1-like esterase